MAVLSPAQIAGYAKGAGWAGNDVVIATAIALAESSGRTDAVNQNSTGTTDKGVWQVNTVHRFPGNLFDPAYNARCAKVVFDRQGWRAWSVYKSGAYQKHLNAARQGAAGAASIGGGGPASSDGQAPAITYGPPGPQIVVAGRGVAMAALGRRNTPLASILLYNKPLSSDVARRVTGEVAYGEGTSTVPNMKITINDAGGTLYRTMAPLWVRGTLVTYLDLAMRVNEVKFTPGNHGSGQIEITAIDALIFALMNLRGPRTASGMDATTWISSELRLAGYNPNECFLGESVPTQSVIARDVESAAAPDANAVDLAAKVNASRVKVPGGEPKMYPDTQSAPGNDVPSGWTTATRLGKELGKRCYTSGRRLVFGGAGFSLTWASNLADMPRIGWYGSPPGERWLELPEVSRVGVGKVNGVIQIKGKVPLDRGSALRSGVGVDVYGTPGIENMRMMITEVGHSIGTDTDGVEVTLLQPIDPTPEPASQQGGQQGGGATAGGGADGQIETFVNLALQQAGDRYVFGAEARLDDPNPSAWDCSELVEWAAWRAGIWPKVPDGSDAQRRHCTPISVDQGIRTKGALLFHPGHVAISLGNGRTIEAYQTGKPVGQLAATTRRFSAAGKIPGAQGYR